MLREFFDLVFELDPVLSFYLCNLKFAGIRFQPQSIIVDSLTTQGFELRHQEHSREN